MKTKTTVTFFEVGRNKATFSAEIRSDDESSLGWYSLCLAVRPHLASRNLSFSIDPEKGIGEVFAGVRLVGRFTFVPKHLESK